MLLLPRIATSLPGADEILVPNPDTPRLGPATVGVTWALTAVCIVMVTARFYVRSKVTSSIGSDDWFMLAAVIFRIGAQAASQKMYDNDLGNGEKFVTYQQQTEIFMYNWIQLVISIPVSILARVSATILLVRIFDRQRWLKWYLIVFTVLMTVVALVVMISVCVECKPVEAFWDLALRQTQGATCWDPRVFQYMVYLGQALFTFSDLTYVLFPVIIIWRLQMPLGQRIGLTLVMMLSLLTVAASTVKIAASQVLSSQGPSDIWWANPSSSVISSGAEQSAVIILGSVPPLLSALKAGLVRLRDTVASLGSQVSESLFRKRRVKSKSSGQSSDESLEPGQQRARPVNHEKGVGRDRVPDAINSSGNDSDPDLRVRSDIWRTDSFVVAYEKPDSRMPAKDSTRDKDYWPMRTD
ncbi:hypothetical protein F4818DRAFT_442460 [Hypoxylon cercidicola]|nr:hypothetical protein F4818DRAFT_442460 [Hypoxylon cercidicola]